METPTIVSLIDVIRQPVEQPVDIPLRAWSGTGGRLQSFLPGQYSSSSVEQIADIPVPHHGILEVFKVFTQDRVQQRVRSSSLTFQFLMVARISKILVSCRFLMKLLVKRFKRFLALFPRGKKVGRLVRTRGRNCSPSRTHPRGQLIPTSSGRMSLAARGCCCLWTLVLALLGPTSFLGWPGMMGMENGMGEAASRGPVASVVMASACSLWSTLHTGKVQVHQNHFHQKKFFIKTTFIKTTFIKNHFHQKPLSSKYHFHQNTTFIKIPLSSKYHFHQNTTFIKIPLSSKYHFHQNTTFIKIPLSSKTTFIKKISSKNQFHQKTNFIKTTFIKKNFSSKPLSSKPLSSKTTFIKNPLSSKYHFHQNTTFIKIPLSSKYHFHQNTTFIKIPLSSKYHFHQNTTFIKKPLSSKNHFHQKTTFIKKPLSSKNHFHQKTNFIKKPISSKTNFIKNQSCQRDPPPEQKQHSPCLCESVAGQRPATPSHKHGLCPPLGSPLAFLLNITGRRPAMFSRKAR